MAAQPRCGLGLILWQTSLLLGRVRGVCQSGASFIWMLHATRLAHTHTRTHGPTLGHGRLGPVTGHK